MQKKNVRVLLSLGSLVSWGVALLSARLYWMGNKPPHFSNSDNPAADSPHLLTRTLTFLHLPAANAWLLLCPDGLSFDWSMDAVPLLQSWVDWRNLHTVAFYLGLSLLALFGIRSGGCSATSKSKETNGKLHVSNGKLITNGNGCHGPDSNHNTELGPVKVTLNGSSSLNNHGVAKASLPTTENLVLFSLVIMTLPFIPATNLFFYVGFVIAERVLYIPSMGFCLLVAAGARTLSIRLRTRGRRSILLSLCVALVLLNGAKTIQRNRDWSNEESLYKSGIVANPAKGTNHLCQRKTMELHFILVIIYCVKPSLIHQLKIVSVVVLTRLIPQALILPGV